MKTIFKSLWGNKVQKTSLRSAAAIASFILISLTVSAQNFWRELLTNNSFGEIAEAMVNNPVQLSTLMPESETTSTFWFTKYMDGATEKSLEIEDWMLNESNFSGRTITIKEAIEKPLELETWMIDQNYPGSANSEKTISTEVEKEEQLQMESWMVENDLW